MMKRDTIFVYVGLMKCSTWICVSESGLSDKLILTFSNYKLAMFLNGTP